MATGADRASPRARNPPLSRIVVAVDPPVSSGTHADACGIIVAGLAEDGRAYVLADCTRGRASPLRWAEAVIAAYHRFEADRIVAEINQGGELVETVIRQIDPAAPVRTVRAMRGKWLRAEPVAALYEQGRVGHVGAFPELEDEMSDFGPDGLSGGASRTVPARWSGQLPISCCGKSRASHPLRLEDADANNTSRESGEGSSCCSSMIPTSQSGCGSSSTKMPRACSPAEG